jgi:protein-disulfide isomerase
LQETLVAEGKVRFVWHNFVVIGPESAWAAEAAQCAAEQGKFWAYHDRLFAEQGEENSGTFAKDNLKRFAAELGLDTSRFDACLDRDRELDAVRRESEDAQRRGIAGTPTLFVNGRPLGGVPSFDQLRAIVEQG